MQYFKDRTEAGTILADKMQELATDNTIVLALSEGGILVGAEIAKKLHCLLYLLATEELIIPDDPEAIGTMSTRGLTYGSHLSMGQLEEIKLDNQAIIDQKSLEAFHKLNRVIGKDGEIKKELLKRHTVILVSDGLKNGLSLDVASDFLKPIKVGKIVVATPIASVHAADRMHLLADQIFCLSILQNYFTTDHYYDNSEIPDHATVVDIMQNIVYDW